MSHQIEPTVLILLMILEWTQWKCQPSEVVKQQCLMILQAISAGAGLGSTNAIEPFIYTATLRNIAGLHRRLLSGSAIRGQYHSANLRLASGFFHDWTTMAFIRGVSIILLHTYIIQNGTLIVMFIVYRNCSM